MPERLPSDDVIATRWRAEVRRVLPGARAGLVEEVTQHVTDRWIRARSEGAAESAADAVVYRELEQWKTMRGPHQAAPARGAWRSGWITDARYALRSLRVRPIFTGAAILLSAIAVGASVTAFAVVYGVLGRALPYPDADRLAVLWQVRQGEQGQISYPDYADVSRAPVFERAAAIMGGRGSLRVGQAFERVTMIEIEAPGLALLGATPAMGRLLNAKDAGQPSVMISHRLWRSHLASDPAVVGRLLWVSGSTYTVAGVLQPGFDFELPITPSLKLEKHDLWTILDPASPFIARRDASTYEAIARLTPGTTFEQAQAAVDAVGYRLSQSHPGTNTERGFRVVPLKAEIVGPFRAPLLLVCAAAAAMLLIALANLATLALIRLSDRRTELAIREALGAGAARLRRQLLTEHAITAVVGGAAGYVLAMYLAHALTASEAAHLPRPDAVRFDAPVRVFAACLTSFVAIVLTLLPLRYSGAAATLRTGARAAGRTGRRARQALVTAELALALALAVGGALLGLSLARLHATDPGFSTAGVLAVRVSAYAARYPTIEHIQSFVTAVLARVASLPGIAAVGAGSSLPLSGQTTGTGVLVQGRQVPDGSRELAGWQFITPGYFEAIGMPLRRGRDFTSADRAQAGHVTIINETLARALFGDDNPLGRRITTGDGNVNGDWHEIIGIAGDVRHHALDAPPAPRAYDLFGEHWGRTFFIVARSEEQDAGPLILPVRRTVADIDPEAPVFEMATMEALVSRSAGPYRLAAVLAGGLAFASLLLALIGVYGVTAASVAERRREIGVRAALGAAPRDLRRLVLGEGAIMAAAGGTAGLAGSVVAARLLGSTLFGVQRSDVGLVVVAVAVLVLLVAVASVYPAARRASLADPLEALRGE